MKGLLLKDFYNIRRVALLMLLFPMILPAICYYGFLDDGGESMGFLAMTLCMPLFAAVFALPLLTNSLVWDENCNYLLYGLTTPIDRNIYLNSKYLFHALTTGVYVLCAVLVTSIVYLLTESFRGSLLLALLGSAVGSYLFAYLLGICFLALSMKFTAVKASGYMASVFPIGGAMFAILGQFEPVQKLVTLLAESGGIWSIAGIILLILAVIVALLFQKIGFWFARKEF